MSVDARCEFISTSWQDLDAVDQQQGNQEAGQQVNEGNKGD